MREYHQKWRYRHPTSQDFFDTVNAVTKQDFTWFFDQFVKGTNTLDYEIAEIKSEQAKTGIGVYGQDGQKDEVKEPKDEKKKDTPYENEVDVRRVGEAWFPVELLFTFEDGGKVTAKPVAVRDGVIEYQLSAGKDGKQWTETWAIKERWKKFKFNSASELITAELDPERKVLLDANLTNNSKTDATGIGAATRWSSGAMFWVQALLQTLSGLA
jgi:hypothetical protein